MFYVPVPVPGFPTHFHGLETLKNDTNRKYRKLLPEIETEI